MAGVQTISAIPNGYSSANSSYSSISSSYPINNAYANSSSTSYAYVTMKTGSTASSYVSLTFDLSAIPATATINSVSCRAKGRVSSTSYVASAAIQLYVNTTPVGTSASFRTTTATVYTVDGGTIDRPNLDNLQLRYTATRGTSNTTRAAYIYIYGADLTVEYEEGGIKHTVTVSSNNNLGSFDADASQLITEGDPFVLNIAAADNVDVSVTDNGTAVSPTLIGSTTPTDILALIHGDVDFSDESKSATISASGVSVSTSQKKFGDQSIYFNGSSYLQIICSSRAYTIDMWVYCTAANESGKYPTIFSSATSNSAGGTYMHLDDGSYSTYPVCRANAASSSSNNGSYGITVISRNTWHHIALCVNGSNHYFFVDGVLQAAVSQSSPNDYTTWYIGALMQSGGIANNCYFTGYMDEIHISSDCKWTASFTPPSSAYSTRTQNTYRYQIGSVMADHDLVIVFSEQAIPHGPTLFYKRNGAWVQVLAVYKKESGVWVKQDNIQDVIDPSAIYMKEA